jgi:hypothetical protein
MVLLFELRGAGTRKERERKEARLQGPVTFHSNDMELENPLTARIVTLLHAPAPPNQLAIVVKE